MVDDGEAKYYARITVTGTERRNVCRHLEREDVRTTFDLPYVNNEVAEGPEGG